MSEILVTPIFLHSGVIKVRVSETELTLVDISSPLAEYFFVLARRSGDGDAEKGLGIVDG
jgi:hypothetical protein